MENIQYVQYNRNREPTTSIEFLGLEAAKQVKSFHESIDIYQPTPLVKLANLAKEVGVQSIFVKDESYRFGLNAFKALGGSYAIAKKISAQLEEGELSYPYLTSEKVREKLGELTFVTATDGNHGRGVAWTAKKFGHKSVVYLPKGSAKERLESIRSEGAEASITDFNYDDTVRYAEEMANKHGWVLVQDTAWDGYTEIPKWIMQGYITMAVEAYEQLGNIKPTHIFLQAGVGSFASSILGFCVNIYGSERPIATIVEPNLADCIFRTAAANDGALHKVGGDMNTIMAGLACGEPSFLAWDIMKDYADYFVSIPDEVAAKGMRILGNPLSGDERVIAGESGAAGFSFAMEILMNPKYQSLKERMGIDKDSCLLFFNTEGDTDKENYRKIVWG
ncbi:MAG: diaminopropionate ammonia-lyase [Clostridiales bacterium]|nr:diaminopropionate ammonia-lyase [Clostridiales bacterium]